MNGESIDLKVLILYQGDEAPKFRGHIGEYINKLDLPELGSQGTVKPIIYQGEGDTFDAETYRGFRSYVFDCDIAIAILTKDQRASSTAGNLWFEIGLWCGLKSDKDILVLVQSPPSNYDEKKNGEFPVKLPSDVQGKAAPRFCTAKETNGYILKFLLKKLKEKAESITKNVTVYKCMDKIRHTIANGCDEDDIQCMIGCSGEYDCCTDNRRELFCLASELIRMEECNGEHFLIQTSLFKIRNSLNRIIDLRYNSNLHWTYSLREIKSQEKELKAHINELYGILEKVFDRKFYNDNLRVWERFLKFCEYRIQVAANFARYYGGEPKRFDFIDLHERAKHFVEWLEEFLHTPGKYINPLRNGKKNIRDENVERMFDSEIFATEMAQILDTLGSNSFFNYLKVLIDNHIEVNKRDNTASGLNKIRTNLPHNIPKSGSPRIWPRTEEEKSEDIKIIGEIVS